MSTFLELLEKQPAPGQKMEAHSCATPNCPHLVTEPWEASGLLCYECAIEGELYDREARWDHVCPIPGTQCLPCQQRNEEKKKHLEHRARARTRH